ncbi:hypothetical protein tb265_18990 [Gemmatimonadetes bacterium T265]|nr:hypothetical protein tb265_18990 [Gemmatimonadetes bacterium T265]
MSRRTDPAPTPAAPPRRRPPSHTVTAMHLAPTSQPSLFSRPLVRYSLLAGLAVVLFAAWYAFRPERLFTNHTVDEAAPTAGAAPTGTAPAAMAGGTASAAAGAAGAVDGMAGATPPAAAGAAHAALATGQFHAGAHPTSGTATILDLGNNHRVLRLTNFSTSDGPDVHVVLVAAPDVADDATVKRAGYVELGGIKGNRGDQNYDVPASTDLAKYRTATIWCERFSANFGSAPLTASR